MGENIFMTGFPGFLGERLLAELAKNAPEAKFTLLVEGRLKEKAISVLREKTAQRVPNIEKQTTIIVGDITRKDLDLSNAHLNQLAEEVTQVFHLAAIYDLAIDYPTARAINVDGTANIIEFCKKMKNLKRHNYISTCYVAGKRTGTVMEEDLDKGQGFKNHYEATKFSAEQLVRDSMKEVPTAIFRPSIVVGDSRTGETAKYDGPYFFMMLLMRLPRWMPMPYIGEGRAQLNLVPVDFCIDALAEISRHTGIEGKTFALADPEPMVVHDFWALLLERLGFSSPPKYTLPLPLVKASLKPYFLREFLRMPMATLDYVEHQVFYDSTNTQAELKGTGVSCPHISTYIDVLIDYVNKNPRLEELHKFKY